MQKCSIPLHFSEVCSQMRLALSPAEYLQTFARPLELSLSLSLFRVHIKLLNSILLLPTFIKINTLLVSFKLIIGLDKTICSTYNVLHVSNLSYCKLIVSNRFRRDVNIPFKSTALCIQITDHSTQILLKSAINWLIRKSTCHDTMIRSNIH